MPADAVISCPQCLRQYAVDPSLNGKLGQCSRCKSQFVPSISMLAPDGDDPVVFDREVSPGCSFIQEACAEMARNACDLLRLAGQEVSFAGVAKIVKSVPLSEEDLLDKGWEAQHCNQMMKLAFERRRPEDNARYREVFEYFTRYIPNRSYFALDSLQGAFAGVLCGVDWEAVITGEKKEIIPPTPETRRGPLERWARKRGWR